MDCRTFEQQAGADDLRRLRPRLPQRGAAGRDRRGAPARVRQQRPDPLPRAAAGAQRLPRRAARRPTSTGWRRTTPRWPRSSTDQVRDHADAAELRLPRPGRDRLRARRRPHHRPVPDPQPRAGQGDRQRHPHPGTPGPRAASRSTAPGTRCSRRAWWSAAAPRPTCGSTTPASAAGTSSSRSTGSGTRRRAAPRACSDLGSTNGMLVDGHRITAHRRSTTAPTVKIGNTTMTVRGHRGGRWMSELTLFLIRLAYLAILWIFVLSAISVIRSDMFGARVPEAARADGGRRPKAPKAAKPPPKRRGSPTHVLVVEGANAGERAELDAGADPDRPRHRRRDPARRRLRLHPARPDRRLRRPVVRRGPRLHQRHLHRHASGSPSPPRSRSAPRSGSARRSSS